MAKIYIIHENHEWTVHLRNKLEEFGLPYEDWYLDKGFIDLSQEPPEGVFYSRMSASSHTRDHRYSAEYTGAVLSWLERHGRQVFNGTRALALEVSKAAQYAALNTHGIRTPHTLVTLGKEQIIEAARTFTDKPFIVKHNRAGKGLGVQLFQNIEALQEYVFGPAFDEPVDGITLVQEYIQAPEPFITRCEFVGGKFIYAVRVDTSGGFELCPADACQIGDLFCPVGEAKPEKPKFQIHEGFDDPIIAQYEKFLVASGVQVAGIEFIVNQAGDIYTYDINTNTNYNSDAEAVAGKYGMAEVAKFLGAELKRLYGAVR